MLSIGCLPSLSYISRLDFSAELSIDISTYSLDLSTWQSREPGFHYCNEIPKIKKVYFDFIVLEASVHGWSALLLLGQ